MILSSCARCLNTLHTIVMTNVRGTERKFVLILVFEFEGIVCIAYHMRSYRKLTFFCYFAVQIHNNGNDGSTLIFFECLERCHVGSARSARTLLCIAVCLNLKSYWYSMQYEVVIHFYMLSKYYNGDAAFVLTFVERITRCCVDSARSARTFILVFEVVCVRNQIQPSCAVKIHYNVDGNSTLKMWNGVVWAMDEQDVRYFGCTLEFEGFIVGF